MITIRYGRFSIAGDTQPSRRALLACDEVLANIIGYSKASYVEYMCDIKNGMLEVVFADDGVHFDPTGYDTKEPDFDLLEDGGMGISLIRQTAAAVKYERVDERNILTLDFEI